MLGIRRLALGYSAVVFMSWRSVGVWQATFVFRFGFVVVVGLCWDAGGWVVVGFVVDVRFCCLYRFCLLNLL